ncbi:MAG: serine hydrolase [Bacteroidia bacterium]|nr:serine hydrolase [Bacteroidia bacterium]
MKNILALHILLTFFLLTGCKEDPITPPPVPDTGIDYEFFMKDLIAGKMASEQIPGLAIAVVRNGEIDWETGYGKANIAENIAVDNNTKFILSQTSDVIVAAALQQASDQGILDLDANINQYLSWKFVHPTFPQGVVSARMLLAHTAGIQDDPALIQGTYGPGDSEMNMGDFLESYLSVSGSNFSTTHFTTQRPGKTYTYSRIGIALAAHLVEIVSEIDFDIFCKTHLFAQLGLQNASWFLRDLPVAKVAVPYLKTPNGLQAQSNYGYAIYPSGQLRISVSHLSRFLIAMLQNGAYGSQNILPVASVADINRVQYPIADPAQAMGWRYDTLQGQVLLGKSGSDTGSSTRMYMDPAKGIGVIILSNGGGYDAALDEILVKAYQVARDN